MSRPSSEGRIKGIRADDGCSFTRVYDHALKADGVARAQKPLNPREDFLVPPDELKPFSALQSGQMLVGDGVRDLMEGAPPGDGVLHPEVELFFLQENLGMERAS